MVRPSKRSTSIKKTRVKTPGGRTTTHFNARKTSQHSCGRCSGLIKGAASGSKTEILSTTKSQRTPSRAYGSVLCNVCVDELVRYKTRIESQTTGQIEGTEFSRDLTLEKFLPRGWFEKLSKK